MTRKVRTVMMRMPRRRLRHHPWSWRLRLRHWLTLFGSPLRRILRSTFPLSANSCLLQIQHRISPQRGPSTLMDSTKKVIPGHPKNMRTRCIPIISLTDSMSAQLMSPSNVYGARFCTCAVIDHLSDVTTCVGTTSAVSLCRLRRMTYPTYYSPWLRRALLRQLSQGPLSMFRIRRRGVDSIRHLSLPVHIAVLAAYSNISSCQI